MPGRTCQQTNNTGDGKYQEKEIVPFQIALMCFMVMILMERPADAVHNIFMRQPGHALHAGKKSSYNQKVNKPVNHYWDISGNNNKFPANDPGNLETLKGWAFYFDLIASIDTTNLYTGYTNTGAMITSKV